MTILLDLPGVFAMLGGGFIGPGDSAMSLEQLRQAVPGLAGLAGLLLFPTFAAWMRLILEYLDWNAPGIGRAKRPSGASLLRAVGPSMLLSFFVLTWFRAASELRDAQVEAPVVGPSIQGLLVGAAFWAFYALGWSGLRSELERRRTERRMRGTLR